MSSTFLKSRFQNAMNELPGYKNIKEIEILVNVIRSVCASTHEVSNTYVKTIQCCFELEYECF